MKEHELRCLLCGAQWVIAADTQAAAADCLVCGGPLAPDQNEGAQAD